MLIAPMCGNWVWLLRGMWILWGERGVDTVEGEGHGYYGGRGMWELWRERDVDTVEVGPPVAADEMDWDVG